MTMELILKGGPVFWLIAASSVVALIVFVERVFHLHRARIRGDDFLSGICNILRRGNIDEALAICEDTPGPIAYIVKTAILHRSASRDGMRDAIDEAGRSEIVRMERRLVIIASVAQTAPLLGLLGTVIGMIRALMEMMKMAPLVQSENIVGWLLQALVTTAAGLTVAIPCYVGYNFLATRIEKIVVDMERAASEIMAFLSGDKPAEEPGTAGK